jgi:integrase
MAINWNHKALLNLTKTGRYTDPAFKSLHLYIKLPRQKYWVFRYKIGTKQRDIGLGSFPKITITEARNRAQKARFQLDNGSDPAEEKKQSKAALKLNKVTFKEFSLAYIDNVKHQWRNDKHYAQWISSLDQYAYKKIGHKSVDEIETNDLLEILNPIWNIKPSTASRLRGRIELILASATARNLRSGLNPATWKGHLSAVYGSPNKIKPIEHHPALPYKDLPSFINKLKDLDGIAPIALEFLILNASRTGEVIFGKRKEIIDNIWVIPKERMKAFREHRVPLSNRSLELIQIAKYIDKDSEYLFSRNGKHLSNMAMPKILKKLDLNITVHGFRSTFRDWIAEETEFSNEVAEKVLAHTISNKVEAAYRRGDLLEKRKMVMDTWEAFCLSKSNVINIKAA